MEELIRLVALRENLTLPEKATNEVLDDLLFFVQDIDTMVMGYVDGVLAGIDPGFELDVDGAERFLSKLRAVDDLSPEDQLSHKQAELLLLLLIQIRDHLGSMS